MTPDEVRLELLVDKLTHQLSESQKECERLKAEVERLIEYSAKMQIRRDDALRDLAEAYEAICILWETPDSALVRLPIEQLDELKAIVQKASAGK